MLTGYGNILLWSSLYCSCQKERYVIYIKQQMMLMMSREICKALCYSTSKTKEQESRPLSDTSTEQPATEIYDDFSREQLLLYSHGLPLKMKTLSE